MNPNYLTMTFDQLMDRHQFLTKKYNTAYGSGASPEVVSQLLAHLDAVRHAMWELGYKQSFNASNGNDPFKDSIA
jgi:hypothetical protein